MSRKPVIQVGDRFGPLVVVERLEPKKSYKDKYSWWVCQCDCGKVVEVASVGLSRRSRIWCSSTCGLRPKVRRKHASQKHRVIMALHAKGMTVSAIGEMFGVTGQHVQKIVSGKLCKE